MSDILLTVLHVASAVAVLFCAALCAALTLGALTLRDADTAITRGDRAIVSIGSATVAALLLARLFL